MPSKFCDLVVLGLTDGRWSYQELVSELREVGLVDLIIEKPAEDPSSSFQGKCKIGDEYAKVNVSLRCNYLLLRMPRYAQRIIDGFSEMQGGLRPFHIVKIRGGVYRIGWSSDRECCREVMKHLQREAFMELIENYPLNMVSIATYPLSTLSIAPSRSEGYFKDSFWPLMKKVGVPETP